MWAALLAVDGSLEHDRPCVWPLLRLHHRAILRPTIHRSSQWWPAYVQVCLLRGGGWGQYSQQGSVGLPSGKLTLSCIWGAGVELKTLDVVSSAKTATATVGGNTQPASIAAGVITFSGAGLKLAKGQSLSVTLGGGDCELGMPTCDGTLRQRHSAWTGTSREDEEQGLAQTSCGPNDVEVVAQQRLLSEQLSGVAMVAGALLMFLLGSLLGPRIQALLELVFRQSTAYM